MGARAREQSSGLILKMINKINLRSLPIILMGDFNSIPDSPPVNKIKTDLSDALHISLKELQGPRGTFNGFNADLPIEKRIDYIFTGNFKVLSYIHINDRLNNNRHISDHLPVMVKIQ
jgi:endonuclease/exonuclease/phosphatase family metal-dependent hydrolase